MIRSRFLWKLYAGYAVLIILTTSLVGVLVGRRLERDSLAEADIRLREKAHLLRALGQPRLEGVDLAGFQDEIHQLGAETDTRYTVIRRDGLVIADSHEDPAVMDDHGSRPEILEAAQRGVGEASRFSDTLRTEMMYLALRVDRDGRRLGFVRVALPRTAFYERLAFLRMTVALAASLASAVALVIGYVIARRLTAPLDVMTRAAASITAGNFGDRVPVQGQDEIGRLASAFNSMSEELRIRIDTITTERNKLLAIIGGMVEGVVAVDASEVIVHMNDVAARLLEADPVPSIGRRIWEVSHLRDVPEVLGEAMRQKSEVAREVRLPGHGRDRVIQMHASPLRGVAGAISGGVVVLHDVTKLRRLETVRTDFVANVSHELKTPLTAIRGLVETVLDDPEMDESTRRRFLGKVRDQGRRLSALVADLLTISRLESTQAVFERVPVDLGLVVRDSIQAHTPVAEEKRISLVQEGPEGLLAVPGDPEGLRQVVDNLVANAVHYTGEEGHVTVRLFRDGGQAVLEVEDDGIGIEPRDLERIFERFYRVDKARSREVGGTGLGLSIVKHIAVAHKGEATVKSSPGAGSTFRVSLPLEAASDPPAPSLP